MIISRKSPLTGKVNSMDIPITIEQIRVYNSGVAIQDAMPDLTPGQREFILSGYSEEDWNKMFPPEELDHDEPTD